MDNSEETVLDINLSNRNGPSCLSWTNLGFSVKVGKGENKTLLHSMNGRVNAGEVVAIMGGSGAGKSTLLNTLAGRIGPGDLTGDILVDGKPRNKATWNLECAYVEQDDVMFTNLTVLETLTFAAALKLPSKLSQSEKKKRVDGVIEELGLIHCRDTRIGNELSKGISGGERKRVSIGMELVSNPKILFLDEPTSGLDSFNAFNTMETIKKLAKKEKKIVLLTIHQPRTDILNLFDKIILLSAGETVWFGTTDDAIDHFTKLEYPLPPKTNPSDFFLDTITIDQRTETSRAESKNRVKLFTRAYKDVEVSPNITKIEDKRKIKVEWPSMWITELLVLFFRDLKDEWRDKATLTAGVAQPIFVTALIALLYFQVSNNSAGVQDRLGVFFFIAINLTFGTVQPLILVFSNQKRIIKRERASGSYRASSAYLAKFFSLIPGAIFRTLLLTIPVYWIVGLQNDIGKFFTFIIICLIHVYTAIGLGLFIAASVPNQQVGLIVTPMIIIVFMLFGGLLLNLNSTPDYIKWIQWISLIAYSNKALVQNEFDSNISFDCELKGGACYTDGTKVVEGYGLATPGLFEAVLCNVVVGTTCLLLGLISFNRTSRPLLRLK
ncbi:P-loop containing nucleoside triphosphate hydrolase protein [Globomyces pollinis-pini]|nr:P-loop containing nucleoside triphosphate hydrolase protein [Globomyces pollinis-pini]